MTTERVARIPPHNLDAERGCPTLVVSREMQAEALGQRILAQTQVPATSLRRRDLREDERRRVERTLGRG